jgi:DNA-directed RNA polymerase specialized sigma subunit
MKGKEIAKEMGVSEGLVSNRNKKIIEWIRKDTNLCEVLANLLK